MQMTRYEDALAAAKGFVHIEAGKEWRDGSELF